MCFFTDLSMMCFDLLAILYNKIAEIWMGFWGWVGRSWSGMSLTTRRKIVVLTILISVPTIAAMYFGLLSVRLSDDQALRHSINVMQYRLKFLESEFIKKEQLLDQESDEVINDVNNVRFTPEVEAFLKNISGSHTDRAAHGSLPPHIERFELPLHMQDLDDYMTNVSKLKPGFSVVGKQRPYVQTIIGVPTVYRPKENYLIKTVKHLIEGLTFEQKQNTIILIYIGETDLEFVLKTAYEIEKEFPEDLQSGLIEIISPDEDYYPDFNKIPPSLGDSQKRTNWRTKQNLDAIFIMSYARQRCLYYLMIEDDVVAVDGYMTEIENFTDKMTKTKPDWFFIQFSTTGGIGKLFRTKTLLRFTAYVQLFYTNMPIDWLLESYLANRNCGIGKTTKQCGEAKELIRPTYKKNLFTHIGRYSSLKGKIQKVKDMPGETQYEEFVAHKNPELMKIKCTLAAESGHSIDTAYDGTSFSWLHQAKAEDVIEFWFKKPTVITGYKIYTASAHHQKDKLYDAVFEAKPNLQDSSFVQIDTPDEFGMLENKMPPDMGAVEALRIKFVKPSKFWLLITEIEFEVQKEKA